MGKDVFDRLESYKDYKSLALFFIYSLSILLARADALVIGGVILWVLLLVRWMKGE